MKSKLHKLKIVLPLTLCVFLSACVSMADLADSLTTAMLNQRDPDTARDGIPAYLLLMDGLIVNDPNDAKLLLAASRLYGSYASTFVDSGERAQRLADTALDYANRAVCIELSSLCNLESLEQDSFNSVLANNTTGSDLAVLYGLVVSWAGWIQVNNSNWKAIAQLPKVEALVRRVLELDETFADGDAHLYMGVLLSLRPAALGGKPEQAKQHFERAIALSNGENLLAKVLYARHYARLVFDQALHDKLLNEVLAADVEHGNSLLINVMAQKMAKELLADSVDYF